MLTTVPSTHKAVAAVFNQYNQPKAFPAVPYDQKAAPVRPFYAVPALGTSAGGISSMHQVPKTVATLTRTRHDATFNTRGDGNPFNQRDNANPINTIGHGIPFNQKGDDYQINTKGHGIPRSDGAYTNNRYLPNVRGAMNTNPCIHVHLYFSCFPKGPLVHQAGSVFSSNSEDKHAQDDNSQHIPDVNTQYAQAGNFQHVPAVISQHVQSVNPHHVPDVNPKYARDVNPKYVRAVFPKPVRAANPKPVQTFSTKSVRAFNHKPVNYHKTGNPSGTRIPGILG